MENVEFRFVQVIEQAAWFWYLSLKCSSCYFICMVWFLLTADQYRWLERDLANVDRFVTPWLVAVWHPPWYSSYNAHYREAECMMAAMEELLYSYAVDIVFNGHVSDEGCFFSDFQMNYPRTTKENEGFNI